MTYDVAYRFQQALDPSALTTIPATLHAVQAAITDARNAGCAIESDPAVILLVRHFHSVCASAPDIDALQEQCEAAIDRLRLVPALPTLAYRGVANDEAAKRAFHREGRVALRALADALGLPDSGYTLTARRGTLAQSGEIILHGDELRVRLSLDIVFPGEEVTYCRVRGRDDHWGDRDRRAPLINLLDPARFAARLRRELTLTPAAEPMALVA
ncbi:MULTISPECIES: hypothetical protein [Sphingomonadaceae]|jgi:hypothetical protein|uniref:Uncharacterized protein n=2 Tax=Sphingomonadaceae TaxID=41297 RepID=A0A7X4GL78_9SPHN|nr:MULTISPECIES: hypothetical protein [Sphingomonadaceae]MCC4253811.1 hypothetical protein [Sphingobium naphthae]HEV7437665.1 hypothetical protein [Pseudorhizobium sp.]ATP22002.1 hypothetical protein BV87_26520 [Sphingobium yanoikuyae]KEZ14651.1 hypothetical protein CP98_04747 [Sphingobium yanoikuyae]KMW28269.1 hypothetical protein BV87_23605 [Sphingobium yanoikuyae]